MKPTPTPCPCGSEKPYDACCAHWHRGTPPPGAEALMRSRYSAYVLELAPYLLATWHTSTRPASIEFEAGTRWLGLSVESARDTDVDHAEVTFIARYRVRGNTAVRMHERSRFVREDGRWYYIDGEVRAK